MSIGVSYEINHRLVRGLDYYNDTIFEIMSKPSGKDKPLTLLAGGRYDGLANLMGAKSAIPAIGWAAGVERLVLGLQPEQFANDRESRIFLLPIVESQEQASAVQQQVMHISRQIRSLGRTAIVGHDLGKPGMKSVVAKGIKSAQAQGCVLIGLVGSAEVASGPDSLVLKNLDTREQVSATCENLEATLDSLLS